MEEETAVEKQTTADGEDDDTDVIGTYLASRERHKGLSPTIRDVTVETGLIAIDNAFVVDSNGAVDWFTDVEEATLDDIEYSLSSATPASVDVSNALSSHRTVHVFHSSDAQRVIRGKSPDVEPTAVVLDRDTTNSTGDNPIQLFKWGHAVTATVTDTGLGRNKTLRWTFDDEEEAEAFAETLRTGQRSETDVTLEHDDGLRIQITEGPDSYRERVKWTGDGTDALLSGAWVMNAVLFYYSFGSLAALLALGAAVLLFARDLELTEGTTTTIDVNDEDSGVLSADDIRQAVGDEVFRHGAVTSREPITVSVRETDEKILFEAVGTDTRRWTIPLDESGTIANEEHIAFLDEVGPQRLEQESLTLMTRVSGVGEENEDRKPTIETGQYLLFPQ